MNEATNSQENGREDDTKSEEQITWASEIRLACMGCLVCSVLAVIVLMAFTYWALYDGSRLIMEVPGTSAAIDAFVVNSGFPDDSRYYYVQTTNARERLYSMSGNGESPLVNQLVFSADGQVVVTETKHRAQSPASPDDRTGRKIWWYTHSFSAENEDYNAYEWNPDPEDRESRHREIDTLLEAHGGRGQIYAEYEDDDAQFREMRFWEDMQLQRKIRAGHASDRK